MFPKALKKRPSPESLLIFLIIVLIVVCWVFLVQHIRMASKMGAFGPHASVSELLLRNKQTHKTTPGDIEYVDAWMTFWYVNFIFGLPEDYLKTGLHIEDPHYAKLPIGRYAKMHNTDRTVLLADVKKLLRNYMDSHPIK